MQVDYLIIGQGICGTMLSWFLHKEGKSFLVIDDGNENASSKIAAGIINPITGRRHVTTWLIEEVMPFAVKTYTEMGAYLSSNFVAQKSIIDFFPSAQMRNAFIERMAEDDTYLHSYPDQNHFNQHFTYDFGCGEIRPSYLLNIHLLLASWKKKLFDVHAIAEQKFNIDELKITEDSINYNNICARKIIFCDGIAAIKNNWFNKLPFAPNKGEALVIECEGLPNSHIFKKGLMLVPLPVQNTFWVGSNYQWEFKDNEPSPLFYKQTTALLKRWLKEPFKVLFHKAAIRPATLERRPFVGFHPHFKNIGILNGMGTKGTSLGPFFAHQMAQHLIHNFPVAPEADIFRFHKILSR